MTTRTPKPAQITLETLPQLFAHHRERFGGWSMTLDPNPGPEPTPPAPTDPPAPTPPAPAPAPTPPTPTPPADPGKKFDQTEVDRIIAERLAKEKAKYDAQIKDLQDNAGKTELEKAQAEAARYKDLAENGSKTTGQKVAKAEARVQALVVGARDDRLDTVIAQADLTGAVGDDGEVDAAKVKAAVEKVLTDFPEWKKTPGKSGGELNPSNPENKPTFTRQQIKDMTPEERVRRVDELNAAAAEGRITG